MPYVYYYEHCCHCPYHIATIENKKYILCSGKERISSRKDFDIPVEKRETFSFPDKPKANYSKNLTYIVSDNGTYKCTICGNNFPKDAMVLFFPQEGKERFICSKCNRTLK